MSEVQEIPLDVEEPIKEEPVKQEEPPEPVKVQKETPIEPAKKAMGRPKGMKDKAPRSKRAPRKEIEQRPVAEEKPKAPTKRAVDYLDDSSSDDSLDAAAMRRVMRSVNKQQVRSMNQKQQMYASWFGR